MNCGYHIHNSIEAKNWPGWSFQVGYDNHVHGLYLGSDGTYDYQFDSAYCWYSEALKVPRGSYGPFCSMYLPEGVVWVLDSASLIGKGSHVWFMPKSTSTVIKSYFEVPSVGRSSVVTAGVGTSKALGIWRQYSTRTIGVYATDGKQWTYLMLDTTKLNQDQLLSPVVINDSTIAILHGSTGEIFLVSIPSPSPVSVLAEDKSRDQSPSKIVLSTSGEFDWNNDMKIARYHVYSIVGEQLSEVLIAPYEGGAHIVLPSRGTFIVVAVGETRTSSIILSY